jgi:predicted RNase H-like HicB family nuclease
MSKIHVEYTVQIWKEDNQHVAHAMPLDVMSAGATPDTARTALDEAVHLFFTTAADMGTLNRRGNSGCPASCWATGKR